MTPSFSEAFQRNISWEIELTTRCQSRCVGCSRYSQYYYPNPFLDTKVELDLGTLRKALLSVDQVDFILLCGVYGDPLLHSRILDVLAMIRELCGDVRLSVHTNGSFGDQDFWKNVASYFVAPGSHIKFALDGLEKSHEAFRRGTQWRKTIKNAQTFMAAGGAAVWKMIEFDHNRSEVEQAREMAQSLGFKKFELRANNYPGLDGFIMKSEDLSAMPASVPGEKLEPEALLDWNRRQLHGHESKKVFCKSLERQSLYLDAHGRVWPCCWVGGLPSRPEHELRQWFESHVMKQHPRDFNLLSQHELSDVLRSPWFSKSLPESWLYDTGADPGKTVMATCLKTCGRCSS